MLQQPCALKAEERREEMVYRVRTKHGEDVFRKREGMKDEAGLMSSAPRQWFGFGPILNPKRACDVARRGIGGSG